MKEIAELRKWIDDAAASIARLEKTEHYHWVSAQVAGEQIRSGKEAISVTKNIVEALTNIDKRLRRIEAERSRC